VISIITFTALFPAIWFDPTRMFYGTLGQTLLSSAAKFLMPSLFLVALELTIFKGRLTEYLRKRFDLQKIILYALSISILIYGVMLLANAFLGFSFVDPFNAGISYHKDPHLVMNIIHSSYMTLFTMPMAVVLGFVTFFFLLSRRSKILLENDLIYSTSMITIAFFIIGAALGGFLTLPRYQIIMYPLYAMIAGLALIGMVQDWKPLYKKILAGVLVVVSVISILQCVPFYIHYSNELNIRDDRLSDAWGFGGYEVAAIMNQMPGAENMTIWTDREGIDRFFVGEISWRGRANPFDPELDADYLTLTRIGKGIFSNALEKYQEGRGGLYATVAGTTPLLEYYEKDPIFYFCLPISPKNCIYVVKVDKDDIPSINMTEDGVEDQIMPIKVIEDDLVVEDDQQDQE